MKTQFDYAVVIGRFQPFHNGHKALIERAFAIANKVVVLVGSANGPRSIKNPFTFVERKHMIEFECDATVQPLFDYKYNDQKWIAMVHQSVNNVIRYHGEQCDLVKVALIGLNKDDSTKYLSWFPKWKFIETAPVEQQGLDATSIRSLLFGGKNLAFIKGVVPNSVWDFIRESNGTDWWKLLEEEYKCIEDYKKSWEVAPYPPTFLTVDAVVVQDGHVLLIKRKASPGKGLWALPGGFVGQNERLVDATIRELKEETKIKVQDKILRKSIVAREVFDAPDRSLRGRTVTYASLIVLDSVGELPKVRGSDDAEVAKWVLIDEINPDELFEDHDSVIQTMVDKIPSE